MKAFVYKLFVVISIIGAIDIVTGYVSSRILKIWPDDGSPLSIDKKVFLEETPECLLLGASQVQHGYNSSIFSDILNLEVWNAGQNGIDVIQNYMYFDAICSRKPPKMVIYDIYPAYLDGSMRYRIRNVNMWRDLVPSVSNYFKEDADWREKIKIKSKLYVYNGLLSHMIRAVFRKEKHDKGYIPLIGKYLGEVENECSFTLDTNEKIYLDKIVDYCKAHECLLFITQQPNYLPNHQYSRWLKNYCDEKEITLFDHVDDKWFLERPYLFYDAGHLNKEGADVYSKILSKEIAANIGQD